jgi:hypothetical protein
VTHTFHIIVCVRVCTVPVASTSSGPVLRTCCAARRRHLTSHKSSLPPPRTHHTSHITHHTSCPTGQRQTAAARRAGEARADARVCTVRACGLHTVDATRVAPSGRCVCRTLRRPGSWQQALQAPTPCHPRVPPTLTRTTPRTRAAQAPPAQLRAARVPRRPGRGPAAGGAPAPAHRRAAGAPRGRAAHAGRGAAHAGAAAARGGGRRGGAAQRQARLDRARRAHWRA